MTESLADKLKAHDYTALTDNGALWVRKALHPAESTIKAPRCPSHGIRPTATQEVIATSVISAPALPEGTDPSLTWSMCVVMKNDPLCPVDVMTYNDDGSSTSHFQFANQGYVAAGTPTFKDFTRTDYEHILHAFQDAAEQYRTTALSITGVFIGASLSDQGSVVSAQMSDPHMTMLGEMNGTSNNVRIPIYAIGQEINSSESLVLGTSPYVTSVKEGFYVPYKMEDPDHWHRTDNLQMCCRLKNGWRNASGVPFTGDCANYDALSPTPYPWGNGNGLHYTGLWLPPLDDGVSVTWCKNMARTSSFRLTVRIAIEVMTRPASALASFCDLPALPDDHAVAMYREIASRMKDCYPSRDNETGSLWSKIKSIAGGIWDTVSPALSNIIPGGKAIVGGVNAVRHFLPSFLDASEKIGIANAQKRADKAMKKADTATKKAIKDEAAATASLNAAEAAAESAAIASQATAKAAKKSGGPRPARRRRRNGVRVSSKRSWGNDIAAQIMRMAGK